MEMNLMKKKYLIGTVLSALVLCIIGIFIYTQYSKPADASEPVKKGLKPFKKKAICRRFRNII